MGITLPQVVTSDRASGAQIVDGSLKFDDSANQHLERTISASNRRTFTLSAWVKHSTTDSNDRLLGNYTDSNNYSSFYFRDTPDFQISFVELVSSTYNINAHSRRMARDTGWYHIVWAIDTTQSTDTDRVKLYVNGVQETLNAPYSSGTPNTNAPTLPSQNYDTRILAAYDLRVGARSGTDCWDGLMSQFYVIDGAALGPENFGFTDGLTNTWRPKKYEGTFGTNGFYLPMDGNSPIGEDKSGKGNDWTPKRFGGSVSLDNPIVSGARPILNTDGGGNVARPGVFGSELNQTIAVTVSNASGNNKYYLDGSLTPNLAFTRGSTITFNTGDSSGNGHPFKLSSTNASGSGGTEYTDGVAYYINGSVVSGSDYVTNYSSGAASGFRGIKWTVPHNQSTTYYYCTIHTGMGNNGAFTSTIDETKADPYAWKNFLALPLVGSDNDVSNSANSGSTAKVATNSSVDASSTQSNFYGGSHYWNANTDSLLYAQQGNDLVFGTGDFTIEFWFYDDNGHNGTGNRCVLFDNRRGGNVQGDPPQLVGWVDSHNEINLYYANGSEIKITVGTTVGKWWHYAAVRSGGTTKLYVDGVEVGSASDTTNYPNNGIALGSGTDSGYSWSGYIQDFRIYNGVAKYTSNFVVPATSPDILPDTPSGVSGGSKLAKVTDGAVNFSASGDKLTVSNSSGDFDFGSGDFTIESYLYMTAQGAGDAIISLYNYGANRRAWNYYHNSNDGNMEFLLSTDGSGQIGRLESDRPLPKDKWVHVAVTKASNVYRMFFDGVQVNTATVSETIFGTGTTADSVGIGDYAHTNAEPYSGFISNIRILKGTALYTANFTPPTRELTNVTNTKLLCCQSNTLAGTAAVVPGASGINAGTPWSEFVTIPEGVTGTNYNDDASNAFDGDTSTHASLYSGNMVAPYSRTTVVFTPPSAITVSSGLRVYMAIDRGQNISVNGTQTNASVSAGWNDTGFTGTLTSLTLGPTILGSSSNPAAFEVDGVILKNLVLPKGNTSATTFNPFTTDINAVRGQETGYPTWNPLTKSTSTLSNGNLTITTDGGSGYPIELVNTFTPAGRGQWYWEFTLSALSGSNYTLLGMIPSDSPYNQGNSNNFTEAATAGFSVYVGYNGSVSAYSGAATAGSATATIGVGGVVGWAYDAENGTLKCFINGVPQGTQFTNIRTDVGWLFGVTDYDNSATASYTINFGQNPFKFPPPAGFQPLNAANVRPETVIARPDQYFDTFLYTGDGASSRNLTLPLAADFLWIKKRSAVNSHQLVDTVRGDNSVLHTNSSNEAKNPQTQFTGGGISSISGTTATLSSGTSTNDNVNANNSTLVAWSWKAGGSKNTFNVDDVGYASAAAAGLDGGTINPTGASVGTKQGFSILKYQGNGTAGANISHGLLEAPKLMIHKSLDQSRNWYTITTALDGSADYLYLNTQGAAQNSSVTVPTSSLMYFTSSAESNNNTENYIVYMWHDVPGLQKFGSFEANQNADGPFIELGFRPAIVWIKNIDNYDPPYDWVIYDNARSTINPNDKFLCANLNNVQNSGSGGTDNARYVDFLSNGFKVRTASTSINLNAHTQLYCAWAEAPEFNLFGGQSNAR